MSASDLQKIAAVIEGGLCTRCGACVGLSRGAITFSDVENEHLPNITGPVGEEDARRLWGACSGEEVDFPGLDSFCFGPETDRDRFFGTVRAIGIAHSADGELRRAGASGGVITTALLDLLNRGEIRGAVVTGMDPERPWRPMTFIARTPGEIMAAAQSKYVITTPNEILPQMEVFDGALAFVGLPCQVHSIRKLQRVDDPAVRKLKFVIGPYCGNTLHFSSVVSLLRSHGVSDHTQLRSLEFREGDWPGNLKMELASGRVISLPKFHANYLIPFFIMKRCLLCVDLTNEFVDLSVGDAWSPEYEERGLGYSIVIARSSVGQQILDNLIRDDKIAWSSLSHSEAISMHTHGLDLKKRGAFIRIKFRNLLRFKIPKYGITSGRFPLIRYIMEIVISGLFWLCGTRFSRFLLGRIDPRRMGRLFVRLRSRWKGMTKSIKGGVRY